MSKYYVDKNRLCFDHYVLNVACHLCAIYDNSKQACNRVRLHMLTMRSHSKFSHSDRSNAFKRTRHLIVKQCLGPVPMQT